MITLTRLSGSVFVLNADLIERIDATPDSVVTLVDGKKYVVAETLAEIIDEIRTYRAEVIAVSAQLADVPLSQSVPPARGHDSHDDDRPLATVAQLPSLGHGEA